MDTAEKVAKLIALLAAKGVTVRKGDKINVLSDGTLTVNGKSTGLKIQAIGAK